MYIYIYIYISSKLKLLTRRLLLSCTILLHSTFPMSPNITTRCNDSCPGYGDDLNE